MSQINHDEIRRICFERDDQARRSALRAPLEQNPGLAMTSGIIFAVANGILADILTRST